MTSSRRACLAGERCIPESIGQALYHQVHHHPRLEASTLAERLGIRRGYLFDAANPDRRDTQFQARLIAPLTITTDDFTVLDYVEQEVGRVALVVPMAPAGREDLFEDVARLARELGEAVEAARAGLADGRLTDLERARVRESVHELLVAAVGFEARVLGDVPVRMARMGLNQSDARRVAGLGTPAAPVGEPASPSPSASGSQR